MRILLLPSEWPHNSETLCGIFVRAQAQALQMHGVQCDVLYVEPRRLRTFRPLDVLDSHFQLEESREDGIRTFRVRGWNPLITTRIGAAAYGAIAWRAALRYLERAGAPDLIHAHNAILAGTIARKLREECGIRFVVTEHSSAIMNRETSLSFTNQARSAYASAERVIAVSEAMAASLRGFYGVERLAVIPNVVDTDLFHPVPGMQKSCFAFLAVARLDKNKSMDLLIRAFRDAFGGADEIVLRIVGDGPEGLNLHELVHELGLDRQVRFEGQLRPEEVCAAMQSSDALVLSSYYETFGVVLVEAMSTGLPVLSTRSGGPDGFVSEEVGILVPPGDQHALAEGLRQVRVREWDSTFIRRYAIENFGSKAVANRLIAEYELVMRGQEK